MKILLKKQDAFDYFGGKYPTQHLAKLCKLKSQAVSMWKGDYVPQDPAKTLYIISLRPKYRRRGKLPAIVDYEDE